MRRTLLHLALLLLLLPGAGSAGDTAVIRLATTTSTENSGLLRDLLPQFERASGFHVHVIAVGTGKALRMGRDGDVDVVLVHAPEAETRFVADGAGVERYPVMHNDFVIVGPVEDPAHIRGVEDVTDALRRIAAARAPFLSRGDDSGTHKKERALWKAAGIEPDGDWYREAGQGMGKVLQMADEMDAYTLSDRGTWLALRAHSGSRLLVAGDPRLYNPYSIIAVNPARFPEVNHEGAMALIRWITGPDGQRRIDAFRLLGEPLFHADALRLSGRP